MLLDSIVELGDWYLVTNGLRPYEQIALVQCKSLDQTSFKLTLHDVELLLTYNLVFQRRMIQALRIISNRSKWFDFLVHRNQIPFSFLLDRTAVQCDGVLYLEVVPTDSAL